MVFKEHVGFFTRYSNSNFYCIKHYYNVHSKKHIHTIQWIVYDSFGTLVLYSKILWYDVNKIHTLLYSRYTCVLLEIQGTISIYASLCDEQNQINQYKIHV